MCFQPGERRRHAVVGPVTEGQVRVVGTVEVDVVGVAEDLPVAVGGSAPTVNETFAYSFFITHSSLVISSGKFLREPASQPKHRHPAFGRQSILA